MDPDPVDRDSGGDFFDDDQHARQMHMIQPQFNGNQNNSSNQYSQFAPTNQYGQQFQPQLQIAPQQQYSPFIPQYSQQSQQPYSQMPSSQQQSQQYQVPIRQNQRGGVLNIDEMPDLTNLDTTTTEMETDSMEILLKDTEEFLQMLNVDNYKFVNLKRMDGKDVNADFFRRCGFTEPFLVSKPDGLDMEIPTDIKMARLKQLIAEAREIPVLAVGTQKEYKLSVDKWIKRWSNLEDGEYPRSIVCNFEVSRTSLAACIMTPKVVRDLDWTDEVWPGGAKHIIAQNSKAKYPRTQLYCTMSVPGGYTDYNISFSGASMWTHIVYGTMLYYFIDPNFEHVQRYHDWKGSKRKDVEYFPDKVGYENVQVVRVNAGETLFVPGGWIYATYTPSQTFAFSGLFLHGLGTETQLEIYKMEKQFKIPKAARFPSFLPMCWYAAKEYVLAFRRVMQAEKDAEIHSMEDSSTRKENLIHVDFMKWLHIRKQMWRLRRARKYDHKAKALNGPSLSTWHNSRKVMWKLHRLAKEKSDLLKADIYPFDKVKPFGVKRRKSDPKTPDQDETDPQSLANWLLRRKKLWKLQRKAFGFVRKYKEFHSELIPEEDEATGNKTFESDAIRETLRMCLEQEGIHSPHDIAHFVPSLLLRKLADEESVQYRFTNQADGVDEDLIENLTEHDTTSDLRKLQQVELTGLPKLLQSLHEFGWSTVPKDFTFVDETGKEGIDWKDSAQKLLKEFKERMLVYSTSSIAEDHSLKSWQHETKENAKLDRKRRQEHERKMKTANKLAKQKQKEKLKKQKEKLLKSKQREKEKNKGKARSSKENGKKDRAKSKTPSTNNLLMDTATKTTARKRRNSKKNDTEDPRKRIRALQLVQDPESYQGKTIQLEWDSEMTHHVTVISYENDYFHCENKDGGIEYYMLYSDGTATSGDGREYKWMLCTEYNQVPTTSYDLSMLNAQMPFNQDDAPFW